LYSCLFLFSFWNEGLETSLDARESMYAAIEGKAGSVRRGSAARRVSDAKRRASRDADS
jgi:hypothetical protein